MNKGQPPEHLILANARYWLKRMKVLPADHALAEADRANAISALEHVAQLKSEISWSLTQQLIEVLHTYLERQGPLSEWEKFLKNQLAQANTMNEPSTELALWLNIAAIQHQRRFILESIRSYRRALFFARRLRDPHSQAVALSNLANLSHERGDYWRATLLCQKALTLFENLGDVARLAATENHMGLIYSAKSDQESALSHYLKSKALLEQTGKHRYRLAKTLHNLGELSYRKGAWSQALGYYAQAKELYQEAGDVLYLARINNNLGNVYMALDQLSQSYEFYIQSESLLKTAAGDRFDFGQVYHNLGMAHTLLKNWREGTLCFERALECWEWLNDSWNKLNTLSDLIELYIQSEEKEKARQLVRPAEQILDVNQAARFDSLRQTIMKQKGIITRSNP